MKPFYFYDRDMPTRKMIGGLLMMASITLIVQAFRLTDHRTVALSSGAVTSYICIAVGFATLSAIGLGAWHWDEIPDNKPIRLARGFAALFAISLTYGLGPVIVASALHTGPFWVDALRTLPILVLVIWGVIKTYRENKSANAGPTAESSTSPPG